MPVYIINTNCYLFDIAETNSSEVPSMKREASKRMSHSRVKGRPRSTDSKFLLNDPKWPHMWYLVCILNIKQTNLLGKDIKEQRPIRSVVSAYSYYTVLMY